MSEHAHQCAPERAADEGFGPGPLHDPEHVADTQGRAFADVGRPEHTDGRRDDHAFRNGEPFTVQGDDGNSHDDSTFSARLRAALPSGRCAVVSLSEAPSAGEPHGSTGVSGTVRLATPAIIDPCPISTKASAPRPTSVS